MKGLFFGGAFNPPTVAHVELANYVRKYLDYDKVVFVPSKDKYIKNEENKELIFTEGERYMMLRRISISRPWMDISDIEIRAEDQPRTYRSMCILRDRGYDLKLLIGSDWLNNLEHGWLYVKEICEEFGIVVMTRNNDDVKEMIEKSPFLKQFASYITIVQTPDRYRGVSSTKARTLLNQLREEVRELKGMLPDELEGLEEYVYEK